MPVTQDQIATLKSAFPSLVENEPLASHTNFRIGGPARLYLVAEMADEIVHAVETAKKAGIAWEILGGGSNVLIADKGVDGLVIQAANREVAIEGNRVSCGAGALMSLVARKVAEAGLEGFEWAVTVPGTIGGAIRGNAEFNKGETGSAVIAVDAYRIADGKRVSLTREECRFGYRDSLFKHESYLILGCVLELASGDPARAMAKMDQLVAKRKEHQPFGNGSAGCMFKNVEFKEESDIAKLRNEVDVPAEFVAAKRIPAGWIVERLGFKGYRLGNVEVSEKHANFLVNLGGATADEVAQVVSMIQMKARDHFGIALKTEVQFLGF
jgi:UDP-N-acetylmuramate dehydrogenase